MGYVSETYPIVRTLMNLAVNFITAIKINFLTFDFRYVKFIIARV